MPAGTPESSQAARLRRRAILLVLGSSGGFAIASGLVKLAAPETPVPEMMFFRSLVGMLVVLPAVLRAGWTAVRPRQPLGHAARVLCGLTGMFGAYYGVAHLPLAAATALGFAMPIFLTVMSVPLLGERVGLARVAAITAGLLGVVLVIRPWQGAEGLPLFEAAVVLGGVLAWAGSMVSIRHMGRRGENNVSIVLVFTAACTVLAGVAAVPVWVWPRPGMWVVLVGIGLVSGIAQLLMTEGYRSGEAGMLAPFEYSAIFYGVVLGAAWGEVPGIWEALGIVVLVVAGLASWWWEGRG